MTDYRIKNKYILSFSDKFCADFNIDKQNFIQATEKYNKNNENNIEL